MHRRHATALTAALLLTACAEELPAWVEGGSTDSIHWSDGDSGEIDGEEFRLANVDSPETGPVGSPTGAKCESERQLGYAAGAFMRDLSDGERVRVTREYDEDGFGRRVLELEIDGRSVAAIGIDAGYLAPWPHDQETGRALTAKPSWC